MVVFLDRMTLTSLYKLYRIRREVERVFCFDEASRVASVLYSLLSVMGVVSFKVLPFGGYLTDLISKYEYYSYEELHERLYKYFSEHVHPKSCHKTYLSIRIDECLMNQYLFAELYALVGTPYLQFVASVLRARELQLGQADYIVMTACVDDFLFSMMAEENRVKYISYQASLARVLIPLPAICFLWGQFVVSAIRLFIESVKFSMRQMKTEGPAVEESGNSKIIHHYTGSAISQDPGYKNEFFWLDDTRKDLCSRLVLAGCNSDCGRPGAVDHYKQRGVRFYGSASGATQWRPGKLYYRTSRKFLTAVLSGLCRRPLKKHRFELFAIQRILLLSERYSYWYDFYFQNEARVISSFFFYDISMIIAIDNLNGFAVTFQDSISNYRGMPLFWGQSHVAFTLSNYFSKMYKSARLGQLCLENGYSYPLTMAVEAGKGRTRGLRESLEQAGAKTILCYFDENFKDFWRFANPDNSVATYRRLFELVLENPEIGLICKPKMMDKIIERLAPIREIMEKAQATGRCHIFHSIGKERATYPGHIATAADICIGEAVGGTAALEAFLVGKKTLLLDHHNLPPYSEGVSLREEVVFSDIESLIDAISKYIDNPEAQPRFGDWTPWLTTLLSTTDGKGHERIASVVEALLDSDPHQTQSQILDSIGQAYTDKWGLGGSDDR